MRQIKFRGRRLDNKEWAYGDFIHGVGMHYGNSYVLPNQQWLPTDCDPMDGYNVDPATVGQFTGLKDRSGKEIYEGDILERYNEQGITMHVDYFGSQFGCIQHWDGIDGEGSWYPLDNYDMNQWEVIGNIHE